MLSFDHAANFGALSQEFLHTFKIEAAKRRVARGVVIL